MDNSATVPVAPPSYSFVEYLEDFDRLKAAGCLEQGPFERLMGEVVRSFRGQYEDLDIRVRGYRAFVFTEIMCFLGAHYEELDQGDLSVYGSAKIGGLYSEHLLHAIHEAVTTRPISGAQPVTVAEVVALADRYR